MSNDPIKQYNPDTAEWEGIKAGSISDGTNLLTPDHIVDYTMHPGLGTTTGIAPNFELTLNPAPTEYKDMMSVKIKMHASSYVPYAETQGTPTLNVNGLGAKPLLDGRGSDSYLVENGVYTFVYNATTGNFIVQGEGVDLSELIIGINSILGS